MKYIFVLGLLTLATAASGELDRSFYVNNTDFTEGEQFLDKALQLYAKSEGINKYECVKINYMKSYNGTTLKTFVINADLVDKDMMITCDVRIAVNKPHDTPSWMKFSCPDGDHVVTVTNLDEPDIGCDECVENTDFTKGEEVLKNALLMYNKYQSVNTYELVQINSMKSLENNTIGVFAINADVVAKDSKTTTCVFEIALFEPYSSDNLDWLKSWCPDVEHVVIVPVPEKKKPEEFSKCVASDDFTMEKQGFNNSILIYSKNQAVSKYEIGKIDSVTNSTTDTDTTCVISAALVDKDRRIRTCVIKIRSDNADPHTDSLECFCLDAVKIYQTNPGQGFHLFGLHLGFLKEFLQ